VLPLVVELSKWIRRRRARTVAAVDPQRSVAPSRALAAGAQAPGLPH